MHKLLKEFIADCDCEIEKLLKDEVKAFQKTGGLTSASEYNLHLLMENREHAKEILEAEMADASPQKHACDEMKGAEEYCAMWAETGDAVYKTMAADELRHAEVFVNQVSDPAVKRGLERKREMLLAKLN